jgi:predicted transposase
MDRTVQIQLHPTPEQAALLRETLAQFTHAFNLTCRYGWDHHEKNGVRLHHATYYKTKAACPGLVSDVLIQARVKATEALKSAFTWALKKEASHKKNADLNASYNIRDKHLASLASIGTSFARGVSSTTLSSQPLGG